ncbi:hypothetical protein, partial [Clostridium sp. HBUAS56017]|uniref:hypothetical protein n=1 Tax=Clostridium sp. HBUAS56017 TaxID=2571128 RepID=UPI00163D43D7
MISDIKVNYAIIGDLRDKIATYKSAIETMEESLNNINSRLETENSGEAVAALISKHEDLKGDISACKGELEDLYKLFSGFHDEMTGIIHPMSYGALMRVDRDDIWWNMQSIIGACTGIGIIRYNVSTYRSFPSFSDSKEEKENQERNYRKIEEIWDIIDSYKSGFDSDIGYMNNLFNSKVVPYEEMDNNYASRAHETYTRYVTTWERIVDGITDFYEGVANFVDGVIKSVEDLIKGLVELVKGVAVYAVGAVAVVISKVTGDTPDWLKGAEEDFYKDNEMIKATLDD